MKWGTDFSNVDVFFKDSICTRYKLKNESEYTKKGIFVAEGELITFFDIAIQAESAMLYVNGNEYTPRKGDVLEIEGENECEFQIVNVQHQYGIYLCTLRRVAK